MDLPKGKINDQTVSLIKSISGGDAIEFEMKYAHPEMGVSQLRFVFGTNFPLNFSNNEMDTAMWDRCVILPFQRSISPEEKNVHLLDELLAEKEEIASFCAKAMPNPRGSSSSAIPGRVFF
jgi:phage/plasmid-associated DNA primase